MKNQISRPRVLTLGALVLTTIPIAGCGAAVTSSEIVMCPGAAISVAQGVNALTVESTSLVDRSIETAGIRQQVRLEPRRERWYGSKGIYLAQGGSSGVHVTAEEGWQFFHSTEELQTWLRGNRGTANFAYTSTGLVAKWSYQIRPKDFVGGPDAAMTVEIWQVFVDGVKPTSLLGAQDRAFTKISFPASACTKPTPFVASKPTTIKGRSYSGRATDFLTERHVSTERVEEVIRNGKRTDADGGNTFYNTGDDADLSYVTTDSKGTVISIG